LFVDAQLRLNARDGEAEGLATGVVKQVAEHHRTERPTAGAEKGWGVMKELWVS
jgi:hypothetical protein